jgi:hypothetical protein
MNERVHWNLRGRTRNPGRVEVEDDQRVRQADLAIANLALASRGAAAPCNPRAEARAPRFSRHF